MLQAWRAITVQAHPLWLDSPAAQQAHNNAGVPQRQVNTETALLGRDFIAIEVEVEGYMLFLASGYLALAECCHGRSLWQPGSLSWWITVINFLGCIAFMVSGVLGYVPATEAHSAITNASLLCTGIGAACFLIGALLLLPEAAK